MSVDTKTITTLLDEIVLDVRVENQIRRLIWNKDFISQKQYQAIQNIIQQNLREIQAAKSFGELQKYANFNIFQTPETKQVLTNFGDDIAQMFSFGVSTVNRTPSSYVNMLTESVKQNAVNYITKMGEDYRKMAGEILSDGLKKQLHPDEISKKLAEKLNITKNRAEMITRTETMRAANYGSYVQARRDGFKYFIVDSRAEACRSCHRLYGGQVFNMDTDFRYIPPLHPRCACIPEYYFTEEEALSDSNALLDHTRKVRSTIKEMGHKIPSDGTGNLWRDNVNVK